MPIAAPLTGFLVDRIGRVSTLKSAAVPYILGWLLIANAPNVITIVIGRSLTGFALGNHFIQIVGQRNRFFFVHHQICSHIAGTLTFFPQIMCNYVCTIFQPWVPVLLRFTLQKWPDQICVER